MDIDIRKHENVQVIRLKGKLALGTPVDELKQVLGELMSAGETLFVLNLGEVPMIDSSGIGVLVRFLTIAKERGGTLKLVNLTNMAEKTLKMVGLLPLFEVFPDETEALESFS